MKKQNNLYHYCLEYSNPYGKKGKSTGCWETNQDIKSGDEYLEVVKEIVKAASKRLGVPKQYMIVIAFSKIS